jgi:hypothetical protein
MGIMGSRGGMGGDINMDEKLNNKGKDTKALTRIALIFANF